MGWVHTGLTNGQPYYYRVQALKGGADLEPGHWADAGDLSRVKVVYAGCCLTGRKMVFADAVLEAGAKFFIGHQVVTAGRAENLIDAFWSRWLNSGAILRNLISIYNDVLRTSVHYRRSRPVIYYRDKATNETRFWRYGVALPDPANIKLE